MSLDRSKELTEIENPQRQGVKGKLNVILHGIFAFDQAETEIVAHIPSMGTAHQYKAGNWLVEPALAEHADLKLEGVTPFIPYPKPAHPADDLKVVGNTIVGFKLDPRHNIIIGDVPVFHGGHSCHCEYATLRFPYPPSPVLSLRRLIIPADALGGDYKDTVLDGRKQVESATVQVLTYDFESDANLRLADHPWEPVLKDGYVNLHVYSEPERTPLEDHRRRAFQANMAIFVGVDLVLTSPALAPDSTDPIPPGLTEVELQDLVQRQRWLALLGLSLRQGSPINPIWDDPTPFAGSDACCGSGGNDPDD